MKIYHYTYTPDELHFPALNENTLYLDIETTGFSRTSTYLTIIGLAWQEDEKIVIEQWFNDKGPIREPILLMELEKKICQMHFPTLVHFNGTTFDLPYLRAKYEQYHLPTSLYDCPSVDLYRIAKKYKSFLQMPGTKQKHLEEAFNLYREDSLSGQELIQAYLDGIKYHDKNLLDMYLLHNKEDMEGMVYLQHLLKLEQFFQGGFLIKDWSFSEEHSTLSVLVNGDFYLKEKLAFSYDGIQVCFESNQVTLNIPIKTLEAKYFYENYRDYYYLPLEDRAIHKSVASFVEKEFRKKATKETCYIKKTTSFLPLPLPENARLRKECLKECCTIDLFFECYGSCMAYVPIALENETCRILYIKNMLNYFTI